MDKSATITSIPDEIITMFVVKEAAIKSENALPSEALLFAKKRCKAGKAGKGGKSPRRDKRDNNGDNDRKEEDLRKCFHSQWRGHITENSLSKHCCDPPECSKSID